MGSSEVEMYQGLIAIVVYKVLVLAAWFLAESHLHHARALVAAGLGVAAAGVTAAILTKNQKPETRWRDHKQQEIFLETPQGSYRP